MKFTDRQKYLLANFHQIQSRRKASGVLGFFLASEECTSTINSLVVKGAVARNRDGTQLRLAVNVPASFNEYRLADDRSRRHGADAPQEVFRTGPLPA